MRRLRQGWMPRPTRRTRDHGLRIAAAALIAAGMAETSAATWVPGNPVVSGDYYSDAAIDLDGDGTDDFLLHVTGYGGPFTLEPLNVAGINNWVFQEQPPAGGYARGATYPVRRFSHRDDVLSATGPVILPPDNADLYPFNYAAGLAGVHMRATIATPSGPSVIETFAYLEFTYVDPYVTIGLVELWDPGTASAVPRDESTALGLSIAGPNPASEPTSFRLSLPGEMNVALSVYDLSGRLVRTWEASRYEPGEHLLLWNLCDSGGRPVPQGVFFVRAKTDRTERFAMITVLR